LTDITAATADVKKASPRSDPIPIINIALNPANIEFDNLMHVRGGHPAN
jgi:hypothetical protein